MSRTNPNYVVLPPRSGVLGKALAIVKSSIFHPSSTTVLCERGEGVKAAVKAAAGSARDEQPDTMHTKGD